MTQPPQILIIDDNPTNLKVAAAHLSDYAYIVLTARSGESGIRRAQLAEPALILLDIEMPGIDGYETCRRLKASPVTAAIPVLYMTARSGIDDKLRAFELGGVDYITKPFEAPELIARVQTHLRLVQQQQQLAQHAAVAEARVAEATEQLRAELAERRAVAAEREKLQTLVRLQSEQLFEQTRRWLTGREDRDQGLAQRLRVDVSERIRLALEKLALARHLAGSDAPGDTAIKEAAALLAPAIEMSEDVGEALGKAPPPLVENPLMRLSSREYEVFQLLAQGCANKEIAHTLGVSTSTVSTYRVRVLEKLEVVDLPGLVRLALQHQRE